MTPWLKDQDLTVWCGDALETLRGMKDGSVDCVVTSPPYWGLRDYGTGEWDGGDPDCDHLGKPHSTQAGFNERYFGKPSGTDKQGELREPFRDVCGKCGARRVDRQLGLEPTPDQYVTRMVEVFREVRRVLASYGTCWVNLGDTYHGGGGGNYGDGLSSKQGGQHLTNVRNRIDLAGLKPKDLVGVPWRVAFALQADGWWLRSDIIWSKPNPMPESVTDRPTKAHEYVFLLTKGPRYWFDQEAVREANSSPEQLAHNLRYAKVYDGPSTDPANGQPRNVNNGGIHSRPGTAAGRNVRSVWEIATQPYPEAHFATFPEELARRCIVAGCPAEVCGVCGKPRERVVEARSLNRNELPREHPEWRPSRYDNGKAGDPQSPGPGQRFSDVSTLGWSDCGHQQYRPGVVLDPFGGSGTVAAVARKHGRRAVLIELNEAYCELIARRTAQQSLLA